MASIHLPTLRRQRPTRAFAPGGVGRGARHAVAAGCGLVLAVGLAAGVQATPITPAGFTIDVSTSSAWYDSNGNLVSQLGAGSRLSVLERWRLQSQPIVSIRNLSTDTSLIGVQLDLSRSASRITSCTWLEAPATSSWNWNNSLASAFFQFRDPIAPGDVLTMRLGTAARPNSQNRTYSMNQTLFHPSLGDCLTSTSNSGAFTLFTRPSGQTSIPQFDASGLPLPGSSTPQLVSLANSPIAGSAVEGLNATTSTVVPVPEPGSFGLAASALGLLAGWWRLRPRAA